MSLDLLPALLAFTFVTSVTPGPNNIMLMTSGANFGLRASVPHMLGVSLGHAAMVAGVGLGLGAALQAAPALERALRVAAVLYMLWLAWKLANAAAPEAKRAAGRGAGRPLTFLQAAAFQWVNPKAWAMALGAVSLYAPGGALSAVLAVAAVFALVNLPSVSLWAALGTQLRRLLTSPARLRAFNWSMAALLLLSLYPVLA